ncbi:tripartite tricarboxylate transporter permease [Candidatus Nanohalococcus occultus]|uniref:tripartite tricarboxylate transporter permease n=1 Tax=Candidatus Nanohalococcus occultus TaxID=2978047 RepID=UPI0039DF5C1A
MIEYLAATVLGVAFGVFTGLVPGIHSNTVVFVSMPFYFRYSPSLMAYMSFIAAVSVAHTFHDFLPSIFFGLAEAETALAALPGPRMAAQGRGLEAFARTVSGGLYTVTGFLVLAPLLFLVVEPLYGFLSTYMFYILVFFLGFAVFRSENMFASVTIVALSGLLGVLTFNSNVNQSYALMPVFSGLFSAPAIVKGISNELNLPEQRKNLETDFDLPGVSTGFLSGLAAGLLPGIGSAISTSFFSPLIEEENQFLTAMGAVNTADIFFSFVALMMIGKSRSGASVALNYLSSFNYAQAVFLIGVSVFAAGLSGFTVFRVAKYFLKVVDGFKFAHILSATGLTVLGVSFYLTGVLGILILLTSSMIGYAASIKGERKSCMAVLIVPAMKFYATGLIV